MRINLLIIFFSFSILLFPYLSSSTTLVCIDPVTGEFISCPPPQPINTGAFIESGGLVVMEAENYDDIISRSSKNWEFRTLQAGFSVTRYMQSLPNTGVNINGDYAANSPELKYFVDFTNPGTYFVWLRGCGTDGTNDSAHAGINGLQNTTANRIDLERDCNSFYWTKARIGTAPDAFLIVGSGMQEINLWMREDGSLVDKILLTTDETYTPTGEGPDESPRQADTSPPSNLPLAFNEISNVQTNIPDEPWVEQKRTVLMNEGAIMSLNPCRLNMFLDHDYIFTPSEQTILETGAEFVEGQVASNSGNVMGTGSMVIVNKNNEIGYSGRFKFDTGEFFELSTLNNDSVELIEFKEDEYFPLMEENE